MFQFQSKKPSSAFGGHLLRMNGRSFTVLSLGSLSLFVVGNIASANHQAPKPQGSMNGVRLAVGFPTPTPEPTPTPSGEYVFDGAEVVESFDQSAQEFEPNISEGSISGTVSDDFDAGEHGFIRHNASRTDSATTTYSWHWETDDDVPPASYTPVYFFNYSGTITDSATGGSSRSLSGFGSASTGGSGTAGGGNVSDTSYGTPQEGSSSISMSQTLTLSSSMSLYAANGNVSGNLNQNVGGSISIQ